MRIAVGSLESPRSVVFYEEAVTILVDLEEVPASPLAISLAVTLETHSPSAPSADPFVTSLISSTLGEECRSGSVYTYKCMLPYPKAGHGTRLVIRGKCLPSAATTEAESSSKPHKKPAARLNLLSEGGVLSPAALGISTVKRDVPLGHRQVSRSHGRQRGASGQAPLAMPALTTSSAADPEIAGPGHQAAPGAPDGLSAEPETAPPAPSTPDMSSSSIATCTLPIIVCLNLRLRQKHTYGGFTLLTLEMNPTEMSRRDVRIDSLLLTAAQGLPPQQIGPVSTNFPFTLKRDDVFSFIYQCTQSEMPNSSSYKITIDCAVLDNVEQNPNLRIVWRTSLESASKINKPPLSAAISGKTIVSEQQPKQMASRNTSLPPPLTIAAPQNQLGQPFNNASSPSLYRNPQLKQIAGINISFKAPSVVNIGKSFQCRLFIVNKSQSTKNLALHLMARETDQPYRRSSTSTTRFARTAPTSVTPLNNDIQLGPILPQACFESYIELVPLSKGFHSLDNVLLFDPVKGESFECSRVLEVLVI